MCASRGGYFPPPTLHPCNEVLPLSVPVSFPSLCSRAASPLTSAWCLEASLSVLRPSLCPWQGTHPSASSLD